MYGFFSSSLRRLITFGLSLVFSIFFAYRTKITREMLIDVEYVINEINIINETI